MKKERDELRWYKLEYHVVLNNLSKYYINENEY